MTDQLSSLIIDKMLSTKLHGRRWDCAYTRKGLATVLMYSRAFVSTVSG